MKRKLIGNVGVDSGQLMIADPAYIDSEWSKKDFQDIRVYITNASKNKIAQVFQYGGPENKYDHYFPKAELFRHYDEKLSTGLSMNEMIQQKKVREMPIPEKKALIGDFSYAGICETTIAGKHQIDFTLGHPGAAVAFRSGYGDGNYPVYGTFNDEGRCIKIEIDMDL